MVPRRQREVIGKRVSLVQGLDLSPFAGQDATQRPGHGRFGRWLVACRTPDFPRDASGCDRQLLREIFHPLVGGAWLQQVDAPVALQRLAAVWFTVGEPRQYCSAI